jgi:hypothetical protein
MRKKMKRGKKRGRFKGWNKRRIISVLFENK